MFGQGGGECYKHNKVGGGCTSGSKLFFLKSLVWKVLRDVSGLIKIKPFMTPSFCSARYSAHTIMLKCFLCESRFVADCCLENGVLLSSLDPKTHSFQYS